MEQYSEQIIDYLYNDMDEPQRKAFVKLMESDAALSAAVLEQWNILQGVHARLVYDEAMEDPHMNEANWLARRAIRRREDNLIAQNLNIGKRIIVARLLAVAVIIVMLFWANLITSDFTPLRGIMNKNMRLFVVLWRRL
jgi:hypothetical protein